MKQLILLTAICLTCFSYSQTKELDDLIIKLTYEKQDSVKVGVSIKVIKLLFDIKNYNRAMQYIDRSYNLATELKAYDALAELKYYKGLIFNQRDDYYNAFDSYNMSLNLYNELNDSLGIAKVNNRLGFTEIKRGNYNKGIRYLLSAIHVFEQKDQLKQLSNAYHDLAGVYFRINHNEEALEYYLKAFKINELLNDAEATKISIQNIARLYALKKEHRKAIEYYEKLLANLTKSNADLILKGDALTCIGEQYLYFREFNKATPFLLDGLKINRTNNNKKGIIKALNNLSKLNLQLGKVRLSEYQLNEAYKLTEDLNNDELLLDNLELKVLLDSTKGQYKSAFNWQREYHKLKNSLTDKKKIPFAVFDESNYNIQQATAPKEKNSTTYKEKTLNRNRYLVYGLGAFLLLSIIVLFASLHKQKTLSDGKKNIENKIRQQKLENASLNDQIEHLVEMNQVKDRLFSIVSHDLKDSITSVKAFLDLLKEKSISREEFDELIPELSENADNATTLLMNLLNWSKSQMQNLDPKPEEFNIQDVFIEKMRLVEKKVKQKKIIMLNESIKDFVLADRSMIEIVIQNLLANAIKFSRVGDVITVSNRERNGNILLCIEDTGVGISKENQEKLFKNAGFTTRGTNHEKGTGLGLSIAKHLIELNNGKIWVESEPNLGSKFFIELPKA